MSLFKSPFEQTNARHLGILKYSACDSNVNVSLIVYDFNKYYLQSVRVVVA